MRTCVGMEIVSTRVHSFYPLQDAEGRNIFRLKILGLAQLSFFLHRTTELIADGWASIVGLDRASIILTDSTELL